MHYKRVVSTNDGFSLAEALVAMGLVLVMSLSLLQSHMSVHRSMHMSLLYSEAMNVAMSFMELERSRAYAAMTTQNLTNITISDAGTVTTSDDRDGNVDITVTDNGDRTKTVQVDVTFNYSAIGQNANHTVSLTTLVADL